MGPPLPFARFERPDCSDGFAAHTTVSCVQRAIEWIRVTHGYLWYTVYAVYLAMWQVYVDVYLASPGIRIGDIYTYPAIVDEM